MLREGDRRVKTVFSSHRLTTLRFSCGEGRRPRELRRHGTAPPPLLG
jgi:hypothetical protein